MFSVSLSAPSLQYIGELSRRHAYRRLGRGSRDALGILRRFLLLAVVALAALSTPATAGAAACSYLQDDFSGLSPNSWGYGSYGTWHVDSEELGVSQVPDGTWALAEVDFLPVDFFSVDVDLTVLDTPGPEDAVAIYPFTSGDVLFSLDNRPVDGVAVVVYPALNQMEFMVWNFSADTWNTTDRYTTPSPLTSFGISYTPSAVVFRANGQDTTLKLSGDFSLAGMVIDTLWLMAKGTGIHAHFDNLCGDPPGGSGTPPPVTALPAPPANFRYTLNGSVITFYWNPVSGADGYRLGVGFAPGAYGTPLELGTATQLGPIDIAGVPAGTYYLAVKAYGPGGEGAYSDEQTVLWQPGLSPPANLRYDLSGGFLTVDWDTVAGAQGYRLAIGLAAGEYSSYADVGDVVHLGPFDVSSLPPATYYLAVSAYNDLAESGLSNEIAITISPGGNAVILGDPATHHVSGDAGTSVYDPATGLEFVFPSGGAGDLTLSPILSGTGIDNLGGQGLLIDYTGSDSMQIAINRRGDEEPEFWLWGIPDFPTDGETDAGETWIPIPPENTTGDPAIFTLPNAEQASAKGMEPGKARRSPGLQSYRTYWKRTIKSTDWAWKRSAALGVVTKNTIRDLYNVLPSDVQSRVRSDYEGRLKPVGYYSGWSSAYIAYTYGSLLLGKMRPHFYFNVYGDKDHLADFHVAAHEAGHYMSHLILGDAKYFQLAAQRTRIHDIGGTQRGRFMIEEYAFFADYVKNGSSLYGKYNILSSNNLFKLKRNSREGIPERDVSPAVYDWPRIEGFGCAFLASLHATRAGLISHYGDSQWDKIPTFELSYTDIYGILAQGPLTVDELYDLSLARLGSGNAHKLAIMAEMLGWSYHGSGKVVDSKGNAVSGVRVENRSFYTEWDEYTTPQHVALMTGNDGIFHLRRLLPGPSYLRVWYDYKDGKYTRYKDFNIDIPKTDPTNEPRDLGTLTIDIQAEPPGQNPAPACGWTRTGQSPHIGGSAVFDGVNTITTSTTQSASELCAEQVFHTTHTWSPLPPSLTPGTSVSLSVTTSWSLDGSPSCSSLTAGASTSVQAGTTTVKAGNSHIAVSADPSGTVSDTIDWQVPAGASPGATMDIIAGGTTGAGGGFVYYHYRYDCATP